MGPQGNLRVWEKVCRGYVSLAQQPLGVVVWGPSFAAKEGDGNQAAAIRNGSACLAGAGNRVVTSLLALLVVPEHVANVFLHETPQPVDGNHSHAPSRL